MAARAAHERGDPRAGLALRRRRRRARGRRSSSPASLLPLIQLPPAGLLGRRAPAEFVVDPRPRPDPATPPRSCSPATSRPSARRAGATSPPGPASPSATSPARAERVRDGLLPRRARHRAARPPRRSRCRRRRRRCRCACSRTGTSRCSPTPTATGSSRPRSRPLKLDAQRRPDRDRRRPRGRELAVEREGDAVELTSRRTSRSAARRASRDPRGGEAHRALLRARGDPLRSPAYSQPRSVAWSTACARSTAPSLP